MSRQPSFVGIDEKAGTLTVAYLASWYHEDRCDDCPRFRKSVSLKTRTLVAICDLMEKEEPCEKTGIGPEGVKK